MRYSRFSRRMAASVTSPWPGTAVRGRHGEQVVDDLDPGIGVRERVVRTVHHVRHDREHPGDSQIAAEQHAVVDENRLVATGVRRAPFVQHGGSSPEVEVQLAVVVEVAGTPCAGVPRTACGCSRSSRSRGRPGRAEAALGIVVRVGNSGCRNAGTRSTSRSRDSNFWSRTKCDSPDDVVRAGVLVYGLIRIVSITGGLRWISASWLRLERRHLSLR